MVEEVVHVMLKPGTLDSGLRELVLNDLLKIGGRLMISQRTVLTQIQISEIYPKFKVPQAKETVFRYFTTNETEHLVFVGEKGIHQSFQKAKGKPGLGGIRGKFYTQYTKLSQNGLKKWLERSLTNYENIDLEMFAYDILHVPDSPEESKRGLRAVFGCDIIKLSNNLFIPIL